MTQRRALKLTRCCANVSWQHRAVNMAPRGRVVHQSGSLQIVLRAATGADMKELARDAGSFSCLRLAKRGVRGVRAIRQLGTVAAVELDAAPGYLSGVGRELAAFAIANDVLLRPLGNVAYCLPPYCTTNDELARVYEVLKRFLDGERAAPSDYAWSTSGGPIDD